MNTYKSYKNQDLENRLLKLARELDVIDIHIIDDREILLRRTAKHSSLFSNKEIESLIFDNKNAFSEIFEESSYFGKCETIVAEFNSKIIRILENEKKHEIYLAKQGLPYYVDKYNYFDKLSDDNKKKYKKECLKRNGRKQ